MSTYTPYHLRVNKAVDRKIFIDFLNRYNSIVDISKHIYIGFGGAMLEDFKLIHRFVPIEKYISLEGNKNIFDRQNFNKPYKDIQCLNINSSRYIHNNPLIENKKIVFWLDYEKPSKLLQQLNDFEELLKKVKNYSVLRISLNANPDSLYKSFTGEKINDVNEKRLKEFTGFLDDNYLDGSLSASNMTFVNLPKAIFDVLKIAVDRAMRNREDETFEIINKFRYQDGQQMITVTGVMLPKSHKSKICKADALDQWDFYKPNNKSIEEIKLPTLTTRERLYLDQALPRNNNFSNRIKRFPLSKNLPDSEKLFENYRKYFKYYPTFEQIFV